MPDENTRTNTSGDTAADLPGEPAVDDDPPLDDMPVPPLTDEDETMGG